MAAVKNQKKYDEQSIRALKGPDRVRKRPGVIFGSNGLEGCQHSVFEIVSNSVDEAREGHGDLITVTVFEDHSIQVEDFGRGVPLGYNEAEGRYNWELIYCELYAGGKYNSDEDSAYEFSLGLNGLGACATQYSSEYMDVYSHHDGTCSEIHFQKGFATTELAVRDLTRKEKQHGTTIRWKPDLEVFTDIRIPMEYYETMLKKQAVVNAGVKFSLRVQNGDTFNETIFCYENGIIDYLKETAGEETLTQPILWKSEATGRDREDKPFYKVKMEACFCFSNTVNFIEYYHNSSYLEHGGSPDKAAKIGFVYAIDQYLKNKNKYTKNETKISFVDVEASLVLITNSFSNQSLTSYENQTKKSITNPFIAEAMTDFFKKNLEAYFLENPADAEKIANQVLINKRSRESAESTRLDLKKKLQGTMDIAKRVEKFVDCRSKDPEKRELFIVEGDSALSSCKLGRSAEFQAIIPVRGKTLNCIKSSYEKIFSSEIIIDLLRVIGCGVEVKTKKSDMVPFDMKALRWSKIILCTDADEDGFQIRTLILTMIYRLLPTLIREGKIYIAESPLFEITTKDETYFAYDEREKAEILKQLGDTKYTLQRSKGLGENEPSMMWKTTMNPATRRLIQVQPDDAEKTAYMFDVLLGDNLEERKNFIVENGSKYLLEADF